MKSYRHTTWQRILRSPIVMIVVIVVCIILAKADWNIHEKMRASALRLEQSQSELTKLQARQTELSSKVSYLSNDQGVESELRTKYLAVRQGEFSGAVANPLLHFEVQPVKLLLDELAFGDVDKNLQNRLLALIRHAVVSDFKGPAAHQP